MEFKKHVHADLIKEYARQKAEGELEYFCWEYFSEMYNSWRETSSPSFSEDDTYRFRMRETHPNYFPELKLGDVMQSEHFTGMVCQVNGKFYIISTKNEGFAGAAGYVSCIGEPWFSEGHDDLEKLAVRCKKAAIKFKRVEN